MILARTAATAMLRSAKMPKMRMVLQSFPTAKSRPSKAITRSAAKPTKRMADQVVPMPQF